MLQIRDLYAGIEGKEILRGLSLSVKPGEVHAIMGPNGSGKSTLAKVLAGDTRYEVYSGQIVYDGADLIGLSADERALRGFFLAFQYPVEIPGVPNGYFLRMAYNAKQRFLKKPELDPLDFDEYLREKMKIVRMSDDFAARAVNLGFSGGEKKRNEIVQMAVLEPKVALLDETDSGLDIDALRIVSEGINTLRSPERSFILITHYQRLLDYVQPDKVHVLSEGKLIRSGGRELAIELEKTGYEIRGGDK